jgi:hypothetical protein
MTAPVCFGDFVVPFHAVDENPALCFERDLELVQRETGLAIISHELEHHSHA